MRYENILKWIIIIWNQKHLKQQQKQEISKSFKNKTKYYWYRLPWNFNPRKLWCKKIIRTQ